MKRGRSLGDGGVPIDHKLVSTGFGEDRRLKTMKIIIKILSYLFVLLFFGSIGWILYNLLAGSIQINPNVLAGIITAISAIIAIILQKNREQRINIQIEHRNRVAPIYEKFIDDIFNNFFYADKLGRQRLTNQEMIEVMAEFTQKILIWGSNDVINAYNNFRESGNVAPGKPSHAILFHVEDLLLAIRKDLGHPTKGFKKGQLLRLFVNDLDDSIK